MIYLLITLFNLCSASDLIVLAPDKTIYLSTNRSDRIEVNTSSYIRIRDLGDKLKITGKKIGSSQLSIKNKQYVVEVVPTSTYSTYQKLSHWINNKRGVYLTFQNKKIVLKGEFLRYFDWQELENVMDTEDEFLIAAETSHEIENQIKNHLTLILKNNHLSVSSFQFKPQWSAIYNEKENFQERELRKILPHLGISLQASKNAITPLPLIEVKILAVEVKRSEIKNLGITWPSTTQFDLLPKTQMNPNLLNVTIQHLEQNGNLKVHASPTLLSQSGEEATFHSGGEFPVKNMNQFNANVIWKKYGILLKILPRADFNGKMDIKIECEVSTMTEHVVEGVPALLMNRISSHFNLDASRTIALSGLIKKEWNQSKSGLPGLMHIPLLQQLFSSESYKQDQSELIFLVTPRITR